LGGGDNDGCVFKIQRYAGIVSHDDFAEVRVWPDDVERFRPALEKVLHSMVDIDPPEPATDFRPKLPRWGRKPPDRACKACARSECDGVRELAVVIFPLV